MVAQPANLTAVCLALAAGDTAGPACLLPAGDQTLLSRLVDQLKRHGVGRVLLLTRPQWVEQCRRAVDDGVEVSGHATLSGMLASIADAAEDARSDLLIAHADVLTHDGVIAGMLADPRVRSGVLSSSRPMLGLLAPRLRISRGRVVASESAYHSVDSHNSHLLGICKVGRADLGEATAAASELAALSADGLPDGWGGEFADKVAARGAKVLAAQAGAAVLAERLHAADPLPDLFPRAAAVRAELAVEYQVRVARPAEALRDDPLALLVVGLIRRDVMLTSAYLREFFWDRPLSRAGADTAYREMAGIDEDRVLLDSAVKATDGFFTTFLVSTYSRYIARWTARRGLTPNQVTSVSMLLGLLAAIAFATGRPAGMIAGAILLQIAFTADCVDGQLARYTRQFSKLGAWLDSVFDRGKEYVVYAGLAYGGVAAGEGPSIWMLAALALALQTFRHYIDFSYAAQQHQALAASVRGSVKAPDEGEITTSDAKVAGSRRRSGVLQRIGRAGVRTSVAFEGQPWRKWAKRIIVLPIGERFALISLTAAIWGPRTTFTSLLVWGAVAAAYTATGRVLRSFA
jgi:phosphatidylglycerophosphate synthase